MTQPPDVKLIHTSTASIPLISYFEGDELSMTASYTINGGMPIEITTTGLFIQENFTISVYPNSVLDTGIYTINMII